MTPRQLVDPCGFSGGGHFLSFENCPLSSAGGFSIGVGPFGVDTEVGVGPYGAE